MILAAQRLGQKTGMVLAVPIPQKAAAEGQLVERAISQALAEVSQRSIQGNEVRCCSVAFWAVNHLYWSLSANYERS